MIYLIETIQTLSGGIPVFGEVSLGDGGVDVLPGIHDAEVKARRRR